MSAAPGLLEEFKRRKVVRVAVVHGATALAVLQDADFEGLDGVRFLPGGGR